MRSLRFVSLPLLIVASPVLAADLPGPVIEHTGIEDLRLKRSDWSGFNAVVFAGGGFTSGKDSVGSSSFYRSGSFGGSVGYDYQMNKVVFGANLEGMFTNFRGTTTTSNSSYRSSSKWLSTATARIGYDAGRFMPYLSAGIGFEDYQSVRVVNASKVNKVLYGFAVGGGVEAKITENIFARADYKHIELSKETINHTGINPYTIDGHTDVFNLGVGYRF
ncbi:MAG: outer membrane beta-barrel protein [Roseibium sp.]